MTRKIDFDIFLGNSPAIYGREIIKGLELRHPPVDEELIADFLGYEIKIITKEETKDFPQVWKILETSPAHLFKAQNIIMVRDGMSLSRKRMSIFHEYGHDRIPWHNGLNFSCSEKAISLLVHQRIEREAFLCGVETMMPIDWMVHDALSLPIELESVSKISARYESSMEATAIRYVFTNPKICGLIAIEPMSKSNDKPERKKTSKIAKQPILTNFSFPPAKHINGKYHQHYPLRVKYFIRSNRFTPFIKPGTGIIEDGIIHSAYNRGGNFRGEISFSELQLPGKGFLQAEGFKQGSFDRMLILLWVEDNQSSLLNYQTGEFYL